MLLSRKRNQTCQLTAIALQTFLIGVFFFGSHPQVFDPLGGYSPLNESRLVSTKDFIETAALRRGFRSDGSQGQEKFLTTGVLYHVQVQRASILHVNHKPAIHEPTLVSFLIRSPPANRDRDT
jgi:hypothetical protein